MKYILIIAGLFFLSSGEVNGQKKAVKPGNSLTISSKVFYGVGSFYADKFQGRKTASGELYSRNKMTAACNILPLNSLIKVTNLNNGKSVVVRTNDRLSKAVKRVVDLSRAAAAKLGYIRQGLTPVKVEVIKR